jgi:hypothetical protein
MLRGVPLAFFGAHLAGAGAHIQHLQKNFLVAAGSSRRQRAGRKTNIRTIHIHTNALSQFAG